jgi:cystathionine beta-lyase
MRDNDNGKSRADRQELGPNTRLCHSGNDPFDFHGFVNPPVVHGSTVLFPDAQTMETRRQRYTYATRGTPTTDALAKAIDALEGSAGTILVPSGLAAVTIPLIAFLEAGDHVLIVDSVYFPTRHFCDTVLKRMGVEVSYYDPALGGAIVDVFRRNTKVVLTESPGSNTFEIQDIPAIAEAAHRHGAIVMMDNTWATPLFFRPLDFGVDLSIHAATKYPGGHSDVLLGTVSANDATINRLRETAIALGVCAAPDDCYAILKGLRTMGVRLERHQQNAFAVAPRARRSTGHCCRASSGAREPSGTRAVEAGFRWRQRPLLRRSGRCGRQGTVSRQGPRIPRRAGNLRSRLFLGRL